LQHTFLLLLLQLLLHILLHLCLQMALLSFLDLHFFLSGNLSEGLTLLFSKLLFVLANTFLQIDLS